jgi:hypothetical protein
MTPTEKNNEHWKLIANWPNTLGTAVMAAGTFAPLAQYIFGFMVQNPDSGLVYGTGGVCVVAGLALHLLGHVTLGLLK